MSDYTPTTDEVRMAYGDARCVDPDDPAHSAGCPQDAGFLRWLAAHDAGVMERAAVIADEYAAEARVQRDTETDYPESRYGFQVHGLMHGAQDVAIRIRRAARISAGGGG